MRDRRHESSHVSLCNVFNFVNTTLTEHPAIHSLTDTCFRKCIPGGNVKNGKLDKYEEPCMRQCVDRFLDANMVVLKELEKLRQ